MSYLWRLAALLALINPLTYLFAVVIYGPVGARNVWRNARRTLRYGARP